MHLEMSLGLIAQMLLAFVDFVLHYSNVRSTRSQAFSWQEVIDPATSMLRRPNDKVTDPAYRASGVAYVLSRLQVCSITSPA
jgi:hypothetical protein